MNAVTLSRTELFDVDLPLAPATLHCLEKVRETYRKFQNGQASRSEYFSVLDEIHSKLFSPSETCFDTDIFLTEAEKIAGGGGKFKYYLTARCRLTPLAKDYIKKYEEFDPRLSSSIVVEKIANLENAHFKFANQVAEELANLNKYKRIFSFVGFTV